MDKSRFEMITDEINQVILRLVESHGYGLKEYKYANDLFLKIDLLERMLELLRIRNKYLENNLPIELFIQGNVKVGDGGLHFIAPQKIERYGSGTPPIQLQPKLLLYLFYRNFCGEMQVYDIISKAWGQVYFLGMTSREENPKVGLKILIIMSSLKKLALPLRKAPRA